MYVPVKTHSSAMMTKLEWSLVEFQLKSRHITFVDKGPYTQSYGFSSSHVRM